MIVACQEKSFRGSWVPRFGWAFRLAYLRWLHGVGRIKPETDQQFADRLGVGLKWLGKWKASERPPRERAEELAIEGAVGHAVSRWLYDETGEPPMPALWALWEAAAGAAATDQTVVVTAEDSEQLAPPGSTPSGARVVAGQPGKSGRAR